MKRISALALLIIASLSTATLALCQEGGLKAKIPFDFTVGDTWMPAGEYVVSSPFRLVIQLRKTDGSAITSVVTKASNHESDSGNELVFNKYGDRYFLHRVLCPATKAMNVDVTNGKAEKRERSLEAGLRGPEETLVAAK